VSTPTRRSRSNSTTTTTGWTARASPRASYGYKNLSKESRARGESETLSGEPAQDSGPGHAEAQGEPREAAGGNEAQEELHGAVGGSAKDEAPAAYKEPIEFMGQEYGYGLPISGDNYKGLPAALNSNGDPIIAKNGEMVAVAKVDNEDGLVFKKAKDFYVYDAETGDGYTLLAGDGGTERPFRSVRGLGE
jgi:hypothetical protein